MPAAKTARPGEPKRAVLVGHGNGQPGRASYALASPVLVLSAGFVAVLATGAGAACVRGLGPRLAPVTGVPGLGPRRLAAVALAVVAAGLGPRRAPVGAGLALVVLVLRLLASGVAWAAVVSGASVLEARALRGLPSLFSFWSFLLPRVDLAELSVSLVLVLVAAGTLPETES